MLNSIPGSREVEENWNDMTGISCRELQSPGPRREGSGEEWCRNDVHTCVYSIYDGEAVLANVPVGERYDIVHAMTGELLPV